MAQMNMGHGLIATLVRGAEVEARYFDVESPHYGGGRNHKKLRPGSALGFAIRDLIAYCDGGGWKVRTISTPITIWRDLQGLREYANTNGTASGSSNPERLILADRGDLIEDREHRDTTVASPWVDQHRRHS